MFTVHDLIGWRADLHPDLLALVDEGGSVSYGELRDQASTCAVEWSDRGVGRGDVVALLDTNSIAYFVNILGLSRLGAVPALLNWRLTAVENQALFELIEPAAVASNPRLAEQLPDELPPIRVVLGENHDGDPGQALPATPEPNDTFALAFSSGTTGRPKGIPWRHDALVRSALVDGAESLGMTRGARHLMVAPTFHLAGLSNSLMGLARGAEIHLRPGFDAERTLDDIDTLGVEYMTAVPAMFSALVQAARRRDGQPDTSSMLEMTYGASPISSALLAEVRELFPTTRLRQFYGMTEIGGALTTLTPQDHDPEHPDRMASAGQVNPGFEVQLVDSDGEVVEDGAPGQIMIKSPSLMDGYWRDPDATSEVLTDGWFASGDIAIRQDGYLTIMDRAKDMIVSGGENVYPAELESVLYQYESIVDVAVIGVPDDRLGERVHAVIVTAPDRSPTLDQIQQFCRRHLAGYKLPRSLDVVDSLPRNATGKLLKRDLREAYWADQNRSI